MIVAAAIKLNDRVYALPAPARHSDLILFLIKHRNLDPFQGEQGFLDDELGFLSRLAALRRAQEEGQILGQKAPITLTTNDLW